MLTAMFSVAGLDVFSWLYQSKKFWGTEDYWDGLQHLPDSFVSCNKIWMGRLESLGGHTLNSPFQGNRDLACSFSLTFQQWSKWLKTLIWCHLVDILSYGPFLYPSFDFVLLPLVEILELEGGFKIIKSNTKFLN